MTEARKLHAAFVQLQRLLERKLPFLELLHDRLELGDRALEVLDGLIHEVSLIRSVPHVTLELALGQSHSDAIPGSCAGRVSDDLGAVGIPADSVAATEDGERAERFEPARAFAELRIRPGMATPNGAGQPGFGAHEMCSNVRQPPAELAALEAPPQMLHLPFANRKKPPQMAAQCM